MPLRNTGFYKKEVEDINPNSPTFGQKKFIDVADPDLGLCPAEGGAQSFRSDAIAEIVFRNNCPDGQTGGSVMYSLPEGHYISPISKQDANINARAYFNSTKQAYANNTATCGGVSEDCGDIGAAPICADSGQAYRCQNTTFPYCEYWSCTPCLEIE